MRLLLATVLSVSSLASTTLASDDACIHWQRKRFEPGAWPSELPERQRMALETWAPWCLELGYRMDLDADGRVLLLSHARHNSVRRETDVVRKTLEAFDELLPWVAPSFEPRRSDDVLRGHLDEPHTSPVVLVRCDSEGDYKELLAELARMQPYLGTWAASAGNTSGFLVHAPLCAGWRDDAQIEEWRPKNELAHHLATLLIEERFGRAPYWLTQGLAWRIEHDVTGSIYAFPGRDGFVSIDAHDGWRDDLQKRYKKRGDVPVALEDLNAWKAGTWDEPYAAQAWGVVTWLEKYRPDALPALVSDLTLYRDVHEVQTNADGSWTSDPRYEVPADVQVKLLTKHAGQDVLAECARFFQKGRGYRPPRQPRAR